MSKKYVTGLVVGKFCPLHNGHVSVIKKALELCERLVILSYTSEIFPGYESEKRLAWLQETVDTHAAYPEAARVRVLDGWAYAQGLRNDSPEDDHRKFCGEYLLNELGTTVQAVFTSEDYGQGFADYLSLYFTAQLLNPMCVEHVMVDKERNSWPISGTILRESLVNMDIFLPKYVAKDFVRKVLFLGAESTGKTTLVKALGDNEHTALEFGRWLFDRRGGKLRYEDMAYIAKSQIEVEEFKASDLRLSEYLYCDTSPLTTKFYSEQWFGRVSAELDEYVNNSSYYKIFLCAPDFPLVQDGTRQDEKFRKKGHEFYLDQLKYKEYTLLTGSLEERIAKVKEELL